MQKLLREGLTGTFSSAEPHKYGYYERPPRTASAPNGSAALIARIPGDFYTSRR